MIITFPYLTRRRGVVKGRRTEEVHYLRDDLTVEIPTLSGQDAPHALRLVKTADRSVKRSYRVWNGNALSPAHGNPPDNPELTIGALQRAVTAPNLRDGYFLAYPFNRYLRGAPKGESFHSPFWVPHVREVDFRSVSKDYSDADRSAAIAIASKIAVVDGIVHTPSQLPKLEVEYLVRKERNLVTRTIRMAATDYDMSDCVHFGGDRRADAEALMSHWQAAVGEDTMLRCTSEFEDDGLVDWGSDDSFSGDLRNSLVWMMGLAEQPSFRTMPREAFQIWCDARELLEKWDFAQTAAPALHAIESFADCLQNAGHHPETVDMARARSIPLVWRSQNTDLIASADSIDTEALAFAG